MNENEVGTFGEYQPIQHPVLTAQTKRIEELQNKVADLENKLATAETTASYHASRYGELQSEYRENEGKLQDILIEALGDEEVDKDVADKIAELYGLDLRKVFSINIQVVVNVEVSAPVGTDPQEIVDNVGFGYGGITYSGVGDLESDSWEIDDWEEV